MSIQRILPAHTTHDGTGIKLRRSIGATPFARVDPFLLLDEFYSDTPDDYIAGFPAHPHRGFESITYMLDGAMQHQDHMGNIGNLGPGDVQWMTAGRSVIHSEMPQQQAGQLRGFQLWLNLPAKGKMQPASYQDLSASQIPKLILDDSSTIKAIAGQAVIRQQNIEHRITGAIQRPVTEPVYLDIQLAPQARLELQIPHGHQGLLYFYTGSDLTTDGIALTQATATVIDPIEDWLQLANGSTAPCKMLVLAGKPLKEPVAQQGPFVMNSRTEIEQALADYQAGQLTA